MPWLELELAAIILEQPCVVVYLQAGVAGPISTGPLRIEADLSGVC